MKDILATISDLREARGWTEYQLAEMSGLPQSTISTWYRKKLIPTVPSLCKICSAFGITLSQLFAENGSAHDLNPDQQRLLTCWSRLTYEQQSSLIAFLESLKQV